MACFMRIASTRAGDPQCREWLSALHVAACLRLRGVGHRRPRHRPIRRPGSAWPCLPAIPMLAWIASRTGSGTCRGWQAQTKSNATLTPRAARMHTDRQTTRAIDRELLYRGNPAADQRRRTIMNRKLLSVRVAPLLIGLVLAGSAGMASAATTATSRTPANTASTSSWVTTLGHKIMCVVIQKDDCSGNSK